MGSGSGGFSEPRGVHCDARFAGGQLYNIVDDSRELENLWLEHPTIDTDLYDALKRTVRSPASGLSFDVPIV